VRWVWLALALAGCGVAAAHPTARPACAGTVAPSQLGAIHFLGPEVGVGLTLPTPRCAAMLAISRDGGRRWLTEGSGLEGAGRVEQLVATSTRRAWAVVGAGRVMSTTDGGTSWTAEPPRGSVMALVLGRRTLWMLDCLGGSAYSCDSVLVRKVLPNGVWTISSPKLLPNPEPKLALAGGRTVVATGGGTVVIVSDGGKRFTERPVPTWMGQPCQTAGLAAAGRNWWLLCLGGAAAGSSDKALLRTTDGGARWNVVSQVTSLTAPLRPGAIPRQEPDAIAAGSPARLWLATQNDLYESGDGGARWPWVRGPDPQGTPASFDVLTPTRAWLLAPGQGLWRTTDGRHWHALGAVVIPEWPAPAPARPTAAPAPAASRARAAPPRAPAGQPAAPR